MRRSVQLTAIFALAAAVAAGQAKFAAADVHASPAGTTESGGFLPNARVEFRGLTLLTLISVAYEVAEDRISGGPAWLATDRFDVLAKAPGKAPEGAMRAMLQTLIAERFDLAVKREEKPSPVYALVVRKAGVAKQSATEDDPECKRDQQEIVLSYACRNVTMASLAERLPMVARAYFDKPVVDRTGLKGAYDFRLEWVGRGRAQAGQTLYASLEKQLGLAVETQTAPMPVLSIERVNRTPTPNAANVTEVLGVAPTQFDVATIRPSRPGEDPDVTLRNGVMEARALSLREMIGFAYEVEEDWVKGGEKWVDSERFDITAKAAPTASADTLRVMLQALLAERFHLKVHREQQPVAVYALTAPKAKLRMPIRRDVRDAS